MPSLYEVLKVSGKSFKGRFGLEIETEVPTFSHYPTGFLIPSNNDTYEIADLPEFRGVIDSSLRNFGVEYVFRKPHDLNDAKKLIDLFAEKTKGVPFIKDAPATSVHVHLNFQNEDLKTLAVFFILYTHFENVLTEFSGCSRRSNLFALPIRVAERTLDNMTQMLKTVSRGHARGLMQNPSYVKYAALNIGCLSTFGTLEVRSMRGETDPEILKMWLELLDSLMNAAAENSPEGILEKIRDDEVGFFYEVFGRNAENLSLSVQDSSGEKISVLTGRNLCYVLDLVRSLTPREWSVFGDNLPLRNQKKTSSFDYPMAASPAPTLEDIQAMLTTHDPFFEESDEYDE